MNKLALHWQIIIGLLLGLFFGVFSASFGYGDLTTNWIAPFGIIFINLLKLIAMPLVLSSIVTASFPNPVIVPALFAEYAVSPEDIQLNRKTRLLKIPPER